PGQIKNPRLGAYPGKVIPLEVVMGVYKGRVYTGSPPQIHHRPMDGRAQFASRHLNSPDAVLFI
ncbi:MAG: hypothetical protein LBQ38_06675, partial [Spirochaetaceae bacterium]|nr:hypothetical protein [Spirochaetaceae bacterium]